MSDTISLVSGPLAIVAELIEPLRAPSLSACRLFMLASPPCSCGVARGTLPDMVARARAAAPVVATPAAVDPPPKQQAAHAVLAAADAA
mmetsp:Transcript_7261/g.23841  ORF Transcript_7261/g.23841 Transcript_7261/m.23841 type:complete len:89 (+) Transcript_7261:590-856(+)|eukprot:scaffold12959_cov116-Isochrysis_galbana.AAC.20